MELSLAFPCCCKAVVLSWNCPWPFHVAVRQLFCVVNVRWLVIASTGTMLMCYLMVCVIVLHTELNFDIGQTLSAVLVVLYNSISQTLGLSLSLFIVI